MQANTEHRAGLSIVNLVLVAAAILVAAVGGLMLSKLMTGQEPEAEEEEQKATPEEAQDVTEYVFLPFDMTVVNLAEARLTRYLSVTLSLQVERESSATLRQVFESDRKAIFKNWLISYLSDKKLEEVKGSASLSELRREILDGFNIILAEHSDERIEAVLFEEFNVQ
jgi:flagellar basal body-associated protein FliL